MDRRGSFAEQFARNLTFTLHRGKNAEGYPELHIRSVITLEAFDAALEWISGLEIEVEDGGEE
jgi:hypothetical protein